MRPPAGNLVSSLFALLALGAASARAVEPVKFNRDIRPILSDKCFLCHGPDPKKREADLRLDDREVAVKAGAITPGQPEESEMIERLLTTDKTDHMPPHKSKLGDLTSAEVATIRRWIAEGAKYEKHWAFLPIDAPAAPSFDDLVAGHLTELGLQPQPEADKNTLLRRVSFDLTGLPPSPEEVAAFVQDASPAAYEHAVDRLLASPHFGERMAVDWLDVSRYADSYGYQVDKERSVWPWRDWVVKAFNENLPFDKFITWQIAGDLLPHPTDEQILATAYNRLHQQESEGGSVEEEYRVEYVMDRVQTFSTTFLGLTFECARCHDHKFDPITQKNYYQLFSLFQNIDEAGLYSFYGSSQPTPSLTMSDDGQKAKAAALAQTVHDRETQLHSRPDTENTQAAYTAWRQQPPAKVAIPGEIAGFGFESLENGKLANWIDPAQPASLKGENKLVPGKVGNAVQFTGDDPVDLPVGNLDRSQPFSVSLWLKTPDLKERAVIFQRTRAWTDDASRGYELLLENGRLKWELVHFWPGDAISIRAKDPVPLNEWTHVVVTYDGSSRANGLHLYVNGRLAACDTIKDSLTREITGSGTGDNITLGARNRDRGFKGGAIDEFRVFLRELTPLEALATMDEAAATSTLAQDEEAGHRYWEATADTDYLSGLRDLQRTREEAAKFADSVPEIMVMHELPEPKKAYILFRGQYDQHRAEVGAGVPEWLAPWPAEAPHNRLGLAEWVVSPQNPLPARVLVNRFWQAFFGRGLVKTASDFGSQGARPEYPEVLDWLAARFVSSGWDAKALVKTIVMSRTYRQRSVGDAKLMADDPENALLARGPRFRLSAEMIRDNALAEAGLLSLKMGGAPVNPYEMSEAFKPATPSGGDGIYRRSLYTTWRRTSPPPAMIAFDAPRRAVCSAKRDQTDSPLQALVLLNGVQFVEAARVLGERLYHDAKGDVDTMIETGFWRCLSRAPDARERSILQQLYKEQLDHFRAAPAEAKAVLATGRAKPDATIPAPESAAAMVLAQTLMNHDASVVKR